MLIYVLLASAAFSLGQAVALRYALRRAVAALGVPRHERAPALPARKVKRARG